MEFYLNRYTHSVDVTAALSNLSYGGDEANLAAALRLVRTRVFTANNGARLRDPQVAHLAVIFTDNQSTNVTSTLMEAAATRKAGIALITVGIGTAVDPYELSAVASYPHHHTMFHVDRLSNLNTVSNPIKRIICRGMH